MKLTNILFIMVSILFVAVHAETTDDGSSTVVAPPSPGKIVIDRQTTPLNRPQEEHKRVAVLTIEFVFDEGVVQSAELLSYRTINSIAPKVFARQGGNWEVTLVGREERSFYVNNPGLREAEADRAFNADYEWVAYSGTLEWPIVLPLYDSDGDLDVQFVTITEVGTRAMIFESAL